MSEYVYVQMSEFLDVLEEAGNAVRAGDLARLDTINEKLKPDGYAIAVRDSNVFVKMLGNEAEKP